MTQQTTKQTLEDLKPDYFGVIHETICNYKHGHPNAPKECGYQEQIDRLMGLIQVAKQEERQEMLSRLPDVDTSGDKDDPNCYASGFENGYNTCLIEMKEAVEK